jgi:nucleoid-associated protein EbfC
MLKDLMKQAQKMQAEAGRLQEELKNTMFEGSAGGGAVIARMTGDLELKEIKIKPEVLKPEEAEMVQDLVLAAVNLAAGLAREESARKMGALTQGLNLPGMF